MAQALQMLSLTAAGLAVATAAGATFCTTPPAGGDAYSYDLSGLPTGVFYASSGVPGTVLNSTNPNGYMSYSVARPCGSVGDGVTDRCIGGPTADPVAKHKNNAPPVTPACTGLGSLNASTTSVVRTADGVNITMQGDPPCRNCHVPSVTYLMICDANAPAGAGPDKQIASLNNHGAWTYTVTWRHPAVCGSGTPVPSPGCKEPVPPPPPPAKCSVCLPPWKPTWNMSRSTAWYGCNASGLHDVAEAVRWGIVVYDWPLPCTIGEPQALPLPSLRSNAKALWANAHPMDDDGMLLRQAEMVLAADSGVWVYRNKIKALNWYGSVREKLDDPAYAGWFVRFKDYKGKA
eukprot:gene2447-3216_t